MCCLESSPSAVVVTQGLMQINEVEVFQTEALHTKIFIS